MSDRLLGAAGLALAGAMAWMARDYAPPFSYEPVGPRAVPLLLAGGIALCSLHLLLKRGAAAAAPAGAGEGGRFAGHSTVLACIGGLFVFALLFQWLGFPLATALMALPVGRVFGGTWKQSALTGAGLGVGLWFMFDKLLDVLLPLGLLAPLGRLLGVA
ncbi:tripartite tricarboxylate transporter TctB family protein [Caldimonas tepidiphila]|uniref:tripartite tricarboxylate transporter TctB family protein n=1 Tax=Caldimonas tepidiphila TaxID=2315841 RepID=UPI000E5BEFE1|nr:tripartite tricarboxylate transporter TctB family protein [Caldimonas tepidiphila]